MKYRHIGTLGIEASVIVLGTWATGGFQWGGTDEKESIRAIHAALDEGINIIDTAPIYGFGESEERVAKAIKGRRDKVILATKCGLVWHVEEGKFFFSTEDNGSTPDSPGRNVYRYLQPESIRYETEKSLSRLGTDYIDLYQVHWMDQTTPISEVMGTLMELKKEGKIRAIGLSNAKVEDIEEYRAAGVVDSDQERYSIFDRQVEATNIPYCAENGLAFLAYSPLFHGLLTGKISPETQFAEDDIRTTRLRFAPEYIEKVNGMLKKLASLTKHHQSTITQLILAYMLNRPGCTHVLVGARKVAHAIENAQAADLSLSSEELESIDTLFSEHMEGLEL